MKRWILFSTLSIVLYVFSPLVFSNETEFSEEYRFYEHLGAPPDGVVMLELKSVSFQAPIQFTGTLSPPSVLMNGKPLRLKTGPQGSAQEGRILINGTPVKTQGELGRFFIQFSGNDAVVDSFKIRIFSASGQEYSKSVEVNRTFLDGTFSARRAFITGRLRTQTFRFELEGLIPEGSTMEIRNGSFERVDESHGRIKVDLPEGEGVITGRLVQKDGSSRILSVPVAVERAKPSPHRLSIEVPRGNHAYEAWEVTEYGLTFNGVTHPGNTLFVEGESVSVGGDGEFRVHLPPDSLKEKTKVTFRIETPEGEEATFEKAIVCKSCRSDSFFFVPRYREKGTFYAGAGYLNFGSLQPRGLTSAIRDELSGSKLNIATGAGAWTLRAGYYHRHDMSVNLALTVISGPKSGTSAGRTLTLEDLLMFTGDFEYSPHPRLFFGGGIDFLHGTFLSGAFINAVDPKLSQFGIHFSGGIRFALGSDFEITSRLIFLPSLLAFPVGPGNTFINLFHFQPLEVRWFF